MRYTTHFSYRIYTVHTQKRRTRVLFAVVTEVTVVLRKPYFRLPVCLPEFPYYVLSTARGDVWHRIVFAEVAVTSGNAESVDIIHVGYIQAEWMGAISRGHIPRD